MERKMLAVQHMALRAACRAGFHSRCKFGGLGTANWCPYWRGWHEGFSEATRRDRVDQP